MKHILHSFILAFLLVYPPFSHAQPGFESLNNAGPAQQQNMILTSLSADEMKLLVADMPPQVRAQLASGAEARKSFAEQLKQVLSLAAEARSAGIANKPEILEQLELMRSLIVAELYEKKRLDTQGVAPTFAGIKEDDIKAFLSEPGQDNNFKHFVQVAREMALLDDKEYPAEQLTELKNEWAKVSITGRNAAKDGFDQQRNVKLHIAFQQARFLAQQFAKLVMEPQIKVTDVEIDAYIAAHPELNEKSQRAKAEMIMKRARRGESFTALAKKYSDDPANKDKGGDLDWFGRGVMVKEFEDAAFALRPGKISDVVQTPFGYHVIKVDMRRKRRNSEGKFEIQVHARHILISAGAGPADPYGAPRSGREVALTSLEKVKRESMVNDIAKRNDVSVAEDFEVEAPPQTKDSEIQEKPPGK